MNVTVDCRSLGKGYLTWLVIWGMARRADVLFSSIDGPQTSLHNAKLSSKWRRAESSAASPGEVRVYISVLVSSQKNYTLIAVQMSWYHRPPRRAGDMVMVIVTSGYAWARWHPLLLPTSPTLCASHLQGPSGLSKPEPEPAFICV